MVALRCAISNSVVAISADPTRCCLMRVDPNHTIPVIHNHDGVA